MEKTKYHNHAIPKVTNTKENLQIATLTRVKTKKGLVLWHGSQFARTGSTVGTGDGA